MYGAQVFSYEAHRQAQASAQVSYEGGDAHAHSALPLPYYLITQVQRGVMPLAAARAPTLEYLMLSDFHRLGRRQFDYLTAQGELRVLQRVAAGGALLDLVLYGLGRGLPTPGTVLVFSSFAPGLPGSFIF